MERDQFEAMPGRQRRIFAEREYLRVAKKLLAELHERDVYHDHLGLLCETHHLWSRSLCPLWYIFQRENLRPISNPLHRIIHTRSPSNMLETELQIYNEMNEIKEKLIKENEQWHTNHKTGI